jgi:hypothetical protein
MLALALFACTNLAVHGLLHEWDTRDASEVLRALPPGRRASAVVYEPGSVTFQHAALAHWAAYYGIRHRGEWAYNFARFSSTPVDFRPGGEPAYPTRDWQFSPQQYDPHCDYARYYDLLLAAMPRDLAGADEKRVKEVLFGDATATVDVLSRKGRFWVFDTARLTTGKTGAPR